MLRTSPASLRLGIMASRYFRDSPCLFAISFRGTMASFPCSARSSITRSAYLPLVDIR